VAELLEIENLTVSFPSEGGRVRAVNGISYALKQGEVIGVVGESGSGKSVHSLAIMGLLAGGDVDAGQIRLNGRNILELGSRAMRSVRGRQIAMIFQDPISSLNPVYTIGFQLCEPLRQDLAMTRIQARERAAELLTLVGIPDARQRLDNYPHELSGGMRQRVMIALAIACNPPLIIADEPTTALDVTIQAQIIELIKKLQRELQIAVIWISHDLGVIAGLAQSVNVMYAGYIVERAPVRDLYDQPRHPYTIGLLDSMPRLDSNKHERLRSIPGRPPDMSRPISGCPFSPRCEWSTDRCRDAMPPTETIAADHEVRCWNWRSANRTRTAA
jgi:oligopeptide transport system ATP-binding protein